MQEINNLNGNVITVLGHAGMGMKFRYPINTYESIEPCLRIGSDGTEMDIQMTKDSVLVVCHSERLEDITICNGVINDVLWSVIKECHRTSILYSKIKLHSFRELMKQLLADGYDIHQYTYVFDCKLYSNNANYITFLHQYANAIINITNEFHLENNLFIESYDSRLLYMLQKRNKNLKLFKSTIDFEAGLNIAKSMNLFGVTINTKIVSAEQIKMAHDNGIRVVLWGMDTQQENIDAVEKSPDYMESDKIIPLLKVFGKYRHNINKFN